ncbi:competence protein CoiA [Sporolactobacillus pectinivorans]|uniref:competence protein CoiA n=1 Tax=Sporolactobacillus pectinivorans TaxID=1591408 RepID=UPI000C25B9A1|nr:competence protein CoiA family protein [Sporolactobacillus pectinivorans]
MLVAELNDGRRISLVSSQYSRNELGKLREREKFYCPVCRSPVLLKIGEKKRWHFSHHPLYHCLVDAETETEAHLAGKETLFRWAKMNGLSAELEHYLPEIHQRPDLLLRGIQPVALEFQCSSISESAVEKRTYGYLHSGVFPVWILGGHRLKRAGPFLKLSGFEPLTIRYSNNCPTIFHPYASSYFVSYYHPIEEKFSLVGNLHPVSKTLFIAGEMNLAIARTRPYQLSSPAFFYRHDSFKQTWLHAKKKKRLNSPFRTSSEEYWVRVQVYHLKKNFSFFPSYVGLPNENFIHFEVSPFLWQMWICLVLNTASRDSWFSPERFISEAVERGGEMIFARRQLPLCPQRTSGSIIAIYLNQLVNLGFVERSREFYRLKKNDRGDVSMRLLLAEDLRLLNQLERLDNPNPAT